MTFDDVRDVRVIYLGGMGRSGSTLAERLLGELPGVCAVGEVAHLWQRCVVDDERCGCGAEFGRCDFWSGVGGVAFGGWRRVDTGKIAELRARVDRTRFIPVLAGRTVPSRVRRDLDEYTGHYLRLYRAIAETSGRRVVVDSSKHASLAFCLSRRRDLDFRVIHLVRDSRAVAYSWTTRVRRPEAPSEPSPSYMTRYSPARSAGEWNTQNGALQLLAAGRTAVLRVRYEDLIGDIKPALRAIGRFAGLSLDEPALDFIGGSEQAPWAELGRTHTAAGNPMRFATGKVPIRPDDRWETAMPRSHRRTVTALTLPLLSRYGYVRGTS